jgi:hypothetical protein
VLAHCIVAEGKPAGRDHRDVAGGQRCLSLFRVGGGCLCLLDCIAREMRGTFIAQVLA